MKKIILFETFRSFLILFMILIFTSMPALATSTRVYPQSGYMAHDYDLEDENGEIDYWSNNKCYSGGLDIYYDAEGSNTWDTRYFLKVEDGDFDIDTTSDDIRVVLFDYNGKYRSTIADVVMSDYGWSQAVKLNPAGDKIWFSYTVNDTTDDWFYSVNTDGTGLQAEFQMNCNWEVEWSTDPDDPGAGGQGGVAFFAGLNGSFMGTPPPHSIFVWTGSTLQKVVEVGGASCGFAFDNNGNLWSGTYTFSNQEYVHMWTASQVDTAVDTNTPLTTANATASFPIPVVIHPVTSAEYAAGANDVECDSDGTIYFSANGGFNDDPEAMTECGYVIQITSLPGDPLDDEEWIEGTHWNYISKSTHTEVWDWQKALAFDGASNLDAGGYTNPTQSQPTGNRLYLDVDFIQGMGPDTIVGHAVDDDYDTDGVPDSLDNAPESPNGDQRDTDHDMYGNICDADFDNDGYVGFLDKITFESNYNLAVPPGDENVDMDGGDYIGFTDSLKFDSRYNSSAPWY